MRKHKRGEKGIITRPNNVYFKNKGLFRDLDLLITELYYTHGDAFIASYISLGLGGFSLVSSPETCFLSCL